jgi:hypothetical protein
MRKLGTRQNQDPWSERVALEHAIRRWDSECENAQRLSNRENGLLTILSAVLGLGFFRITDFSSLPLEWSAMIRTTLSTSVVLVMLALFRVFLVPRRRGHGDDVDVYASAHLAWPHKSGLHPGRLSEEKAVRIALTRTVKAAASLHRRNVRRRAVLEQGQRFLVAAVVLAATAAVVHMYSERPEKPAVPAVGIPTDR